MAIQQILSPLPGTFYRKPAPDQAEFKAEGADVAHGEVIGLIEVMKNFIEVKADLRGRIVRFFVNDGQEIMAGQPLVEIETGA